MHLFSNVKYHLSSSLSPDEQTILTALLDANGATKDTIQNATHIITDSLEFDGWQSVGDEVEVVTVSHAFRRVADSQLTGAQSKWVERSTVLGKCQP